MEDANQEANEEKNVEEFVRFVSDFAKTIYASEVKREERTHTQSSQIQAAFAFTIAALFVLLQVLVKTTLPTVIIIWAFSTVCFVLLASLVCAICVQLPYNRQDYPTVESMMKNFGENYDKFDTSAKRSKYSADFYAEIQKGITDRANKNMKLIRASMFLYLGAIILCVMWFVVMLCVAFC